MRSITAQSEIEKELLEATGFVPEKRYRKRQDYLAALLRATCDLEDSAFEKLTDSSAEWAYKASDAYQAKQELPDFNENERVQTETNTQASHSDTSSQTRTNGNRVEPEQETWEEDNKVEHPSLPFEEDSYEDPHTDESEEQVASSDSGAVDEAQTTEKPKAKRGRKPKDKSQEPKEVKIKAKREKKENGHIPTKPRHTRDKWGITEGTVSEVVFQMLNRPNGTTMNEIREATGHYRYNVVNRLVRLGWNVTKDGQTLKCHGRVDNPHAGQPQE